jgi:hypothetical protein
MVEGVTMVESDLIWGASSSELLPAHSPRRRSLRSDGSKIQSMPLSNGRQKWTRC